MNNPSVSYSTHRLTSQVSHQPLYGINSAVSPEKLFADPNWLRSLVLLMDQFAVNGGAAAHWGGPSALAEILSVVGEEIFSHQENWKEAYHITNDIGHAENAFYALKALHGFAGLSLADLQGFRSLDSKLTGHGEAHLFPEGVLLSNGPLSSSLGMAQGLCFADRLIGNDRMTISFISDGAMMEGEAKEAISCIPGLFTRQKMNPFLLILSDNDTKLSGRISLDSFSMEQYFKSLQTQGWDVVKVEEGNSLDPVYQGFHQALSRAKTKEKPVVLWLKTTKGYGLKTTQDSASGGHGYPGKAYTDSIAKYLEEIWQGKIPQPLQTMLVDALAKPADKKSSENGTSIKKEKIQVGVSKALIEAAQKGKPVFSISSDLAGSTGLGKFHAEFPELKYDVGIAEANMVSMASGLSQAGYIPVVDTFAAFGITKGNLPLIMNSLSLGSLIGIFSHTGFQDAADGASHQSLTYLSALASIPNLECIFLSTSQEAYELVGQAIQKIEDNRKKGMDPVSFVFFLGRETFVDQFPQQKSYSLDQASLLREGEEGMIISSGSMIHQAVKAAEILSQQHQKNVTVINHSHGNKIDTKTISTQLGKMKNSFILTVEDHQVLSGFGSICCHQLLREGVEFKFYSLGVDGRFGRSAYKADHLYRHYGIDANSIVTTFLEKSES